MSEPPTVQHASLASIAKALAGRRRVRYWRGLLVQCWTQFERDDNFRVAGVLSYTTLLALVPLLAVVLGVVSAFPAFAEWSERVQDFLFSQFVPAAGATVQQYVRQFVGNARVLTGPGALFLVLTALLLMSSIEAALNRIWQVTAPRRWRSRILVYWAMLTLGPLLLGGSLALTSALGPAEDGWWSGPLAWLTGWLPFLVAFIGFGILFVVVPNRAVPWRAGFAGALVAALLFEGAKLAFVWYVTTFPTYEKLYGALAVVPIFLVWIYLTWTVILIGAGISAALASYRLADGQKIICPGRYDAAVAWRVVHEVRRAAEAQTPLRFAELAARLPADEAAVSRVVGRLRELRWVALSEEGWLLPVGDCTALTLGDLCREFPAPLVLPGDPAVAAIAPDLAAALAEVRLAAQANLDRPLQSYVQSPHTRDAR